MHDYRVVIPSYKRDQTLKTKTLSVLKSYEIDPERVHIFVADDQEYEVYKKMLRDEPFDNLHIGLPGLGPVRNYIRKHFPEGTPVMNFDDDLIEIQYRVDEKRLAPIPDLERDLILRGFDALKEHDANLFGIYAAANPYFMKKDMSTGLYYIIGSCWGHFIRHDDDLILQLEDKEDFERTLQYYDKDGIVVRLDNITVKSNYYTEPGGMQEDRTSQRIEESARALVERFPDLCTMYTRKTTGHAELRLRDSRPKPVEVPDNNIESFF